MKTMKNYFVGFGLIFLTAFFAGCTPDNHVKILYSNESSAIAPDKQIRWREAQTGLSYANVLVGQDDGTNREFFVVTVDPALFEFRVYSNADQAKAKTLKEIHNQQGSVLTFNGAFFDTQFKAMGFLQDSKGTSHRQISSELMNGVFVVSNVAGQRSARVYSLDNVPKDKNSFMIQNGPVLIDNDGNIPLSKDTGKLAARTVLGVDGEGNVVLVVLHQSLMNTDNALSLYQMAHVLKENFLFASLGLHSVLNLDGGPSTGVAVGGEYIPEINSVQNAVVTLPRPPDA